MLWAIMRGSFALAKTLWVRTETPLRAALLGHEICRKLLEEKARGEALGRRLRELMEHLLGRACGLLDNIADVEVARKVLQSKKGCARRSAGRKIDASNIDIAIEFRIKAFVAHSHCQAILDEMWMGRTPEVGRVKLQRMEVMPRLWLALLSPRRVVTLMANDLNQENTKLLHALGASTSPGATPSSGTSKSRSSSARRRSSSRSFSPPSRSPSTSSASAAR